MRREGLQIGKIYGIPIYLHASWIVIFLLIAASFYSEYGALHLDLPASRLALLGIMTALLFCASLVVHELAHSVVAKHYKIPVASITLFVFGGVSRITREPSRAIEEFNIGVAGPLSSLLLGVGFWLLYRRAGSNEILATLASSLAWVNVSLGIFNLIPGFPLDGGHIFRAMVWTFNKNFERATRIAAITGQVFAYAMIALGVVSALGSYQPLGGAVGGLWLAFIGWFILSAAKQTQAQVEARGAYRGAGDFARGLRARNGAHRPSGAFGRRRRSTGRADDGRASQLCSAARLGRHLRAGGNDTQGKAPLGRARRARAFLARPHAQHRFAAASRDRRRQRRRRRFPRLHHAGAAGAPHAGSRRESVALRFD
jgi:Zn-dependent protease